MRLLKDLLRRPRSVGRDFFDFLFPPYCAVCDALLQSSERIVCESCFQSIRVVTPPFCQHCGRPFKTGRSSCAHCRDHPTSVKRTRALGLYQGALSCIIHLLKYEQKPSLARRLGLMMSTLVLRDPWFSSADLVIPVPLHPVRERERGYNQSRLLARAVSESTGLPLASHILMRRRNTRSQTDLPPEERLDNVADAFAVRRPQTIEGKRILLVDDVTTTGSTLHFCGTALLAVRVQEVYAITCAIA